MVEFILALDQGTTSCRAILIDHQARAVASAQQEFTQYFPSESKVEHDAIEIWETQLAVSQRVIIDSEIDVSQIKAIGIANQRETTVVWDKKTGIPISPAIVWQDRRTSSYCNKIKRTVIADKITAKTGLIVDAYFSATKIKWLLEHVQGAQQKAVSGELAFGTIDTWLIYKLTNGKVHATDVSNASRTMLYNIHDQEWDRELCDYFHIPMTVLPEVKDSSGFFGNSDSSIFGHSIPIMGVAGDQQAALFGQACFESGMIKNTYGTGCFMMMNTGIFPVKSQNKLLTTIAWKIGDEICYALEGSVFVGGAVMQWLRDGLGILNDAAESEQMAFKVENTNGVFFVPALTGLAAPDWDPNARGLIIGISRSTSKEHIVRAALEGIAFQVNQVLQCMNADAAKKTAVMKVDGGGTNNKWLMQFQSDISNLEIVRAINLESTALGAAFLAGLAAGIWKNKDELKNLNKTDQNYSPKMSADKRNMLKKGWEKALQRSKSWIED